MLLDYVSDARGYLVSEKRKKGKGKREKRG